MSSASKSSRQQQKLKFSSTTNTEARKPIMSSASKSCELDLIPTNILKIVIHILLPVVTTIINKSLAESSVPSSLKHFRSKTQKSLRAIAQFQTFPSFKIFWKRWSVDALSITLYQTICKILTNLHTA